MLVKLVRIVAALGCAAALASCGGEAEEGGSQAQVSGPLAPVYESAREEPQLTWYSSQDPARNDAVVEAFQERYPDVEVQSLRLATGALATRYAQERESDVVTAGLITLADPIFANEGLEKGWFETFGKEELPSLGRLGDEFFDRGVATTGISVLGIAYNTNAVENPPRTWQDVLAPEYRGNILFGDARNVPSYLALARIWRDEYGPEFLEAITAQEPTVVDSMVPGTQQLAAEEAAIAFPNVLTVVDPLKADGAPLDFVTPDTTTGNEFASIISKGSKSPNAARLLYDFLLTDEGQVAFNGETSSSPLGVEGTAPLPPDYIAPRIDELPSREARLIGELGLG